jgi:hypothetical protein
MHVLRAMSAKWIPPLTGHAQTARPQTPPLRDATDTNDVWHLWYLHMLTNSAPKQEVSHDDGRRRVSDCSSHWKENKGSMMLIATCTRGHTLWFLTSLSSKCVFSAKSNLSLSAKVDVIAHRWGSGYMPDHTALESGANWIELDAHSTKVILSCCATQVKTLFMPTLTHSILSFLLAASYVRTECW